MRWPTVMSQSEIERAQGYRFRTRFAWLPTRLNDGTTVWLERYRTKEFLCGSWDGAVWEVEWAQPLAEATADATPAVPSPSHSED